MIKKIPVIKKKGSADVIKRLAVLDKKQRHAVLATSSEKEPYASLIAYALTPDTAGIVFATPRLTRKYRNIIKNRNICLLIDTRTNSAGDYMKAESISVLGRAQVMKSGRTRDELIKTFLRKHPELKDFIHAPSTALVFMKINRCIHVSSFQVVSEYP
jgi:nitroimidazol reductase NimA-like FMN-containing flavoprotein (pyridoxamine 5'-phosphate oxidase superfamily)